MSAPAQSWVVKTPKGRVIEETRSDTREQSIAAMEKHAGNTWRNLSRRGYRACIEGGAAIDSAMGATGGGWMMCAYEDADPAVVLSDADHKAVKPHRCSECGRTIKAGEHYNRQTTVCDGRRETHKVCAHCEVCRDWLQHECGGWVYGGVGQEIADHYYDGYAQVGRLAVGMRRKWQRFGGGLMPIPDEPINSHQRAAMGAGGGE
jgi:hypothetical protein